MNARADPPARRPIVEFRAVTKRFDAAGTVVDALDLAIEDGEFLTLLGPSGSGKTTTLMMLAGFEAPSSGEILLRGKSLAGKPAYRRNMGVVFQNYALFPHMTVAENLAFPLQVRGCRGAEAGTRVTAALDLVSLAGLGDRRIGQLSGGQQQRVALARALIFDPDVVLMDEPLGALDRQLREKLQGEIKRIQRQTGVTMLYVTHDQSEALALSDRIAIFAHGRIQQLDTPSAVYRRPANAFVADFVGENNRIEAVATGVTGEWCTLRAPGGHLIRARAVGSIAPGDNAIVTIRPEQIQAGETATGLDNSFDVVIEDRGFHGDHCKLRACLQGGTVLTARIAAPPPGNRVLLGWRADDALAFPAAAPALAEVAA